MLSASSSGPMPFAAAARWRPPAGTLPLAAFVVLLVICLGNSTAAANWVPNSGGLTNLALVAALVMGVLAMIRPLPWPVALGIGALLAPAAAYFGAHGVLVQAHPDGPSDLGALFATWMGPIASGAAANDVSFYLYLLYLLFWVVGGWLAWCSLRWRQPLLGVVPGAAAFATNVLNFPAEQNAYVLAFLVLTLGLLLWNSYQRSVDTAVRRRVKLSPDARFDFWETGAVVAVGVVMLGIFMPPLSTSDRTVDFENGTFRGWAELQQRLNHPVAFGAGQSTGVSVGFEPDVKLGGPVHKTGAVVMTYQRSSGSGPST